MNVKVVENIIEVIFHFFQHVAINRSIFHYNITKRLLPTTFTGLQMRLILMYFYVYTLFFLLFKSHSQ